MLVDCSDEKKKKKLDKNIKTLIDSDFIVRMFPCLAGGGKFFVTLELDQS